MYSPQLKTFIIVAETGSFSKAAEELYITPASVMKQINILEEHLGLKLFLRSARGAELTDAGKQILDAAKRMIKECDLAVASAKKIQANTAKTIRLGSSLMNSGKIFIEKWNKICPNSDEYNISMVPFNDSDNFLNVLISSLGVKFDFMTVAFRSADVLKYADMIQLGTCNICISVPRAHPLSKRKMLQVEDLYGEHVVIYRRGDSSESDAVLDFIESTHPQIILEEQSTYFDLNTFNLCAEKGWLFLSLDVWDFFHPSLVNIPVDWDFKTSYNLVYSKNISGIPAEFLNNLKIALKNNNEQ